MNRLQLRFADLGWHSGDAVLDNTRGNNSGCADDGKQGQTVISQEVCGVCMFIKGNSY